MRPRRECLLCIINVRLREVLESIEDSAASLEKQIALVSKIAEEFRASSELTNITSNIYEWVASNIPEVVERYRDLKRRAIDAGFKSLQQLRARLDSLNGFEKFYFALRLSIAGNTLDTGVYARALPQAVDVEYVLGTPMGIDHSLEIYEYLRSGTKEVAWLFDNAGEAVYDLPLIELIRSYGNRVVGVVKEDPGFQNDLTVSDALYMGLGEHVDEVVSTMTSRSTIHLDRTPSHVVEMIRGSDLVVSKGMAHYEYLSNIDLGVPVAFLLIPKCEPVASALGTKREVFVAYFRK